MPGSGLSAEAQAAAPRAADGAMGRGHGVPGPDGSLCRAEGGDRQPSHVRSREGCPEEEIVCYVGRDTQEFVGRRALWAEAPGRREREVSVAQAVWKVRGAPRTRGICSFSALVSAWGLAVLVVVVVRSLPDLSPRMFLTLRCGFHSLGAETFRARCREEG